LGYSGTQNIKAHHGFLCLATEHPLPLRIRPRYAIFHNGLQKALFSSVPRVPARVCCEMRSLRLFDPVYVGFYPQRRRSFYASRNLRTFYRLRMCFCAVFEWGIADCAATPMTRQPPIARERVLECARRQTCRFFRNFNQSASAPSSGAQRDSRGCECGRNGATRIAPPVIKASLLAKAFGF
jgi:hypothetical protein